MQASACFILSVNDNIESILDWHTTEGIIFRGGSGPGINLSKIRGSTEPLSRGGTASVSVSFMRGADASAGSINKSGGCTRGAARMFVLDVDHHNIQEFIWCKASREEDKATALRNAGFDISIDGDGFFSIQYQNDNNSARATDDFMSAAAKREDWNLIGRTRVSRAATRFLPRSRCRRSPRRSGRWCGPGYPPRAAHGRNCPTRAPAAGGVARIFDVFTVRGRVSV